MKDFIKSVQSAANETDDYLTEIFGSENKNIFLQIDQFPKFVRLPFEDTKRDEVFKWIKTIDNKAEIVPQTGVACRLYKEENWSGHIRYYLGDYHLQTLASMLPPLILDPQPHETVLDIASAPGSKTTEIADMMANTGRLVANDSNRERILALISNLDRLSVTNVAITNRRGEQMGNLLPDFFDRILVDAPCSSIGTPEKWKSVKNWIKPKNIKNIVTTQIKLLISAAKAVKPGGIIVYSTCTLNPLENEAVVDWVLKNLDLEIEKIEQTFGLKKIDPLTSWHEMVFDNRVENALKISPVDNPTEGFFMARFRKASGDVEETISLEPFVKAPRKLLAKFFESYQFEQDIRNDFAFHSQGNKLSLTSTEWEEGIIPFTMKSGLKIAEQRKLSEWRFTQSGAQFLGMLVKRKRIELDDHSWAVLMDKRRIKTSHNDGYYILIWNSRPVTYGFVEKGSLKIKIGRSFVFSFDEQNRRKSLR